MIYILGTVCLFCALGARTKPIMFNRNVGCQTIIMLYILSPPPKIQPITVFQVDTPAMAGMIDIMREYVYV